MSDQFQARLDAADSVFFQRQLETIDARVYEKKYPKYKARGFIPTQPGVSPYDRVYTYRMYDTQGQARYMGQNSDDAPRSNASGEETPQTIKDLEVSYSYNLLEIQAAARTGTPLDELRAMGARRAMEEKIDRLLSIGDAAVGIKGLLTLTGTTTVTPSGFWGTLATANPDLVASDLLRVASAGAEATDEAFNRFMIVLPFAMYNLASQLKISDVSNTTVLQYVRQVSPFIEDVQPWFRCERNQAGDSTHDLIVAFPRDVEAVAGIVPRELEFLAPQQRNFDYVINGHASCGGVVARYPKAITIAQVPTS